MKNQNQPTFDVLQGPLAPVYASSPLAQLFTNDHTSPWSPYILETSRGAAQKQRSCSEALRLLYQQVPNPTDNVCVADAHLQIDAFNALGMYISEHPSNGRLLLYFPLELLPTQQKKVSSELQRAATTFRDAYIGAWYQQLAAHDYRANFLDGDIPEVELRTNAGLAKTVKAAQLAPALVVRGMLSPDDVARVRATTSDELLQATIDEAFASKKSIVTTHQSSAPMSAQVLAIETVRVFQNTASHVAAKGPSLKRASWLAQEEKRTVAHEQAKRVVQGLQTGTITNTSFVEHLLLSSNEYLQVVAVIALRRCAATNPEMTSMLYLTCQAFMHTLWQHGSTWLQSEIESTTLHLKCYEATRFHTEHMSHDYRSCEPFAHMQEQILSVPELSKRLLPVVVAYGSRMKGYGAAGADLDAVVFVRPEVSFDERAALRDLLANHFPKGSAVSEFWLSENAETLALRTPPEPDSNVHDVSSVYPLLCGTWIGEHNTQAWLYKDILEPYLHPAFRHLIMPELERTRLQFRLMHRGYNHCHPTLQPATGDATMDTHHGSFWDPGYRRLASILFLEELFIPL